MKIEAVVEEVIQQEVHAVIVNFFEGNDPAEGAMGWVDRALNGTISTLVRSGEIKGKRGETTLIHTSGKIAPLRVLVVGLGSKEEFGPDIVRQVMASSVRFLQAKGVQTVATVPHGLGLNGLDAETAGEAIAEGTILGLYNFDRYRTAKENDTNELQSLRVVLQKPQQLKELAQGIERGRLLASGANIARDLVNEPANVLTPTELARRASAIGSEVGLTTEVLGRKEMQELGMGALLAVASGSSQEPKLIVLKYQGDPDNPQNDLGLVGKGITFDSGGISLKQAGGMWEMKGDMGGGAAVIGAMDAIARLKIKLNVTGIVAAAENMPGGSAQRPGDIVRAMNGKTIEVDNTDAEGRMALADALCYAQEKLGLRRLVDMATLTGAVIVALGNKCTGILGTNQELVEQVIRAGERAGEKLWQLPLFEEYKEQNKSNWADVKNTGGRGAGAITAAHFIGEFTEGASWAHLDIAGTFMADTEQGYLIKGATGIPVRTLVHLASDLSGAN